MYKLPTSARRLAGQLPSTNFVIVIACSKNNSIMINWSERNAKMHVALVPTALIPVCYTRWIRRQCSWFSAWALIWWQITTVRLLYLVISTDSFECKKNKKMTENVVTNWTLYSNDYLNGTGNDETSVSIEWDDSMWTPKQRRLLQQGAVSRQVIVSLGILLAVVILFGIISNSTVLYVFSR